MPQKAGGTRIAGMRLPKGCSSPGVRAVDQDNPRTSCVDPSIRLRGSAVLQLLLFAADPAVREAAARALERCVRVGDGEMRCHDCDFAGLPFADRIAARIVASMYDESSKRRGLFGVLPHKNFDLTPPCPVGDTSGRVYRLVGGRVRAWRDGGRNGGFFYRVQDTFVLPSRPEQFLWRPLRSMQRRGTWFLKEGSPIQVRFMRSRELGRAVTGWEVPRLLNPEGRVECALPSMPRNPLLASLEIDTALLMRLVTGRLAGHTIAFRCESRRMRGATIEASIELGELDGRPPLLVGFKGWLKPSLDIESRLGIHEANVPLLGGATIECLDLIARRAGVRFGESLRGSFAYHPLRARGRRDAA
jgi:hypothetical protein